MLTLLALPLRQSKLRLLAALVASVTSGISTAALIALISRQLAGSPQSTASAFIPIFAGLVLLTIVLDLVARRMLDRLSSQISHALRLQLAQQVLDAPLARLEQLGVSRITTALTEDVRHVSQSVASLPALVVAVATALGCLLYLAWISPFAVVLLGLLGCPLWLGSRFFHRRARHLAQQALATRDRFFRYLLALTEGVKELQLHRPRQQAFMRTLLEPTAAAVRDQRDAAHLWHHLSGAWSHSVYFLFILIVMILASRAVVLPEVLSSYALVVLYLRGSLWTILAASPQWADATLSLQHLEAAGFTFSLETTEPLARLSPVEPFADVAMQGVVYRYRVDDHTATDSREFMLGPIDLTFRAGELVFVAGGNGSGKTTLLKLLGGLYEPEHGSVSWNGRTVTSANRAAYRQNFSAVFTEPFVFAHLLGLGAEHLDERARDYLARLQLTHIVGVTNGQLSTTDLSHGQRKRLALLTAYLEDRPVYLFDEWAASQDPEFRSVFYLQLLPELKARGKLVVVITHDDQYFHVADRLLTLDFGQVVTSGRRTAVLA